MKKFTLTTIAMLMAGTACVANASDKIGAYATVNGSFGSTYNIGGAVGYSFNELLNLPVRAEVEYNYARSSFKDNFESAHFVFANAAFDFSGFVAELDELGITPYVSAGLGYAYNKETFYRTDYSAHNFAYNAGWGVNYKVMDDLSVNAGYRFLATITAKDKGRELSVHSHVFNLGVTYSF